MGYEQNHRPSPPPPQQERIRLQTQKRGYRERWGSVPCAREGAEHSLPCGPLQSWGVPCNSPGVRGPQNIVGRAHIEFCFRNRVHICVCVVPVFVNIAIPEAERLLGPLGEQHLNPQRQHFRDHAGAHQPRSLSLTTWGLSPRPSTEGRAPYFRNQRTTVPVSPCSVSLCDASESGREKGTGSTSPPSLPTQGQPRGPSFIQLGVQRETAGFTGGFHLDYGL